MIIVLIRGSVPRVLLNRLRFGLYSIHLTSEVVCRSKVKRRRSKLNVTSTQAGPAIPCGIDPADEVEVTHVLDRTEIGSLEKPVQHDARLEISVSGSPILQIRSRRCRRLGLPSRGSPSATTCNAQIMRQSNMGKGACTHFHVSIKPGWYTAPQLKYFISGTSGVCSLNSRIAAGVRHVKAEPSPPPLGSMSRSERKEGKRSGPTVSRKWSAKEDPRCGLDIVVIERMRKVWSCRFEAR
jgi:hypothetical protein